MKPVNVHGFVNKEIVVHSVTLTSQRNAMSFFFFFFKRHFKYIVVYSCANLALAPHCHIILYLNFPPIFTPVLENKNLGWIVSYLLSFDPVDFWHIYEVVHFLPAVCCFEHRNLVFDLLKFVLPNFK